MPIFTIVVPTYNSGAYLSRCLTSLARQTFSDFQVLVIDDASTDDTNSVFERSVGGDNRFLLIHHDENRGLHLARKTGVVHATGTWTLFLDSDDELTNETVLENLACDLKNTNKQILTYRVKVDATQDTPREIAIAFQAKLNRLSSNLNQEEFFEATFTDKSNGDATWHMIRRVFDTQLLKQAFSAMISQRLDRAEDAYELFVIASMSNGQDASEVLGYTYHLGAGITNFRIMEPAQFSVQAKQCATCCSVLKGFARSLNNDVYVSAAQYTTDVIQETTGSLMLQVERDNLPEAARGFISAFGSAIASRELWRFVRDRAYDFIAKGVFPSQTDILFDYLHLAESCEVISADEHDFCRYHSMRNIALSHLNDLKRAEFLENFNNQLVRIFVTTHKDVDIPDGYVYQPVQVGASLKNNRFNWAYHDDEGDNIEDKNPMYCEMTVQYWAWKNALSGSKYVGFCHYRRYFNFSDTTYKENAYGEVMDDFIDADAIKRYGLDDESAYRACEGYDVITTGFHDLRKIPGNFSTPREHYAQAPLLHVEDIDRMLGIIARLYPDYVSDARAFLSGHESCFCNMYVMRTPIFEEYCNWLFPILDEFVAQTDMSHYSKEALRTPGHLAERLFNIYYRHAQRTGVNWKTKQVQCVHFEMPERHHKTVPAIELYPEARNMPVVPVVFASDDNYVPMLATTIRSMLANANPNVFLDIYVLERNIAGDRKALLGQMVAESGHASVRFLDVKRLISGYNLSTNNEHISLETYYRFLVQELLPFYSKVLYLDSDLIVRGDVTKLYETNVSGKLIAAAHDIDYLGNLNMNDGKRMAYTTEKLGLEDPYGYFQAGVLLLNTHQLRKLHSVDKWMQIVSEADYIYDDQDILNAECQGRVVYLPFEWNVMHNCDGRVQKVFTFAPNDTFDAYNASRSNPQIIHYAGFEKPWVNLKCDFAAEYWKYAKQTPFYEELLGRMVEHIGGFASAPVMPVHEKAVDPASPLRRLVDPIAPYGTARREVLKSIGRTVQGKK